MQVIFISNIQQGLTTVDNNIIRLSRYTSDSQPSSLLLCWTNPTPNNKLTHFDSNL